MSEELAVRLKDKEVDLVRIREAPREENQNETFFSNTNKLKIAVFLRRIRNKILAKQLKSSGRALREKNRTVLPFKKLERNYISSLIRSMLEMKANTYFKAIGVSRFKRNLPKKVDLSKGRLIFYKSFMFRNKIKAVSNTIKSKQSELLLTNLSQTRLKEAVNILKCNAKSILTQRKSAEKGNRLLKNKYFSLLMRSIKQEKELLTLFYTNNLKKKGFKGILSKVRRRNVITSNTAKYSLLNYNFILHLTHKMRIYSSNSKINQLSLIEKRKFFHKLQVNRYKSVQLKQNLSAILFKKYLNCKFEEKKRLLLENRAKKHFLKRRLRDHFPNFVLAVGEKKRTTFYSDVKIKKFICSKALMTLFWFVASRKEFNFLKTQRERLLLKRMREIYFGSFLSKMSLKRTKSGQIYSNYRVKQRKINKLKASFEENSALQAKKKFLNQTALIVYLQTLTKMFFKRAFHKKRMIDKLRIKAKFNRLALIFRGNAVGNFLQTALNKSRFKKMNTVCREESKLKLKNKAFSALIEYLEKSRKKRECYSKGVLIQKMLKKHYLSNALDVLETNRREREFAGKRLKMWSKLLFKKVKESRNILEIESKAKTVLIQGITDRLNREKDILRLVKERKQKQKTKHFLKFLSKIYSLKTKKELKQEKEGRIQECAVNQIKSTYKSFFTQIKLKMKQNSLISQFYKRIFIHYSIRKLNEKKDKQLDFDFRARKLYFSLFKKETQKRIEYCKKEGQLRNKFNEYHLNSLNAIFKQLALKKSIGLMVKHLSKLVRVTFIDNTRKTFLFYSKVRKVSNEKRRLYLNQLRRSVKTRRKYNLYYNYTTEKLKKKFYLRSLFNSLLIELANKKKRGALENKVKRHFLSIFKKQLKLKESTPIQKKSTRMPKEAAYRWFFYLTAKEIEKKQSTALLHRTWGLRYLRDNWRIRSERRRITTNFISKVFIAWRETTQENKALRGYLEEIEEESEYSA